MPTFELPKVDLPEVDLPSAEQIVGFARDAAYVGVGLAVMTAERLQALQQQLVDAPQGASWPRSAPPPDRRATGRPPTADPGARTVSARRRPCRALGARRARSAG